MSRCFGEYSPDEKVDVLSFHLNNMREQVDDLKEKIWMLENDIGFLLEGIHKLPPKQRDLTLKRAKRLRKSFLAELESSRQDQVLQVQGL